MTRAGLWRSAPFEGGWPGGDGPVQAGVHERRAQQQDSAEGCDEDDGEQAGAVQEGQIGEEREDWRGGDEQEYAQQPLTHPEEDCRGNGERQKDQGSGAVGLVDVLGAVADGPALVLNEQEPAYEDGQRVAVRDARSQSLLTTLDAREAAI